MGRNFGQVEKQETCGNENGMRKQIAQKITEYSAVHNSADHMGRQDKSDAQPQKYVIVALKIIYTITSASLFDAQRRPNGGTVTRRKVHAVPGKLLLEVDRGHQYTMF